MFTTATTIGIPSTCYSCRMLSCRFLRKNPTGRPDLGESKRRAGVVADEVWSDADLQLPGDV